MIGNGAMKNDKYSRSALLFGKGTTSNVYSHVDSESKKLCAEAIAKALSE